jgi:hypothetical protein
MKNAVYGDNADIKQQFWQRMQDAANEIRAIPGASKPRSNNVLTYVFMSM